MTEDQQTDPFRLFPYQAIVDRPPIKWPNGARVAVWVIPNVEFFALDDGPYGTQRVTPPAVPEWAARDYGNRVGIFRLIELFDRYRIRATVALNSDVCAHHPEILEAGAQRGWEWMGHNRSNTTRLNAVPPDEERSLIAGTLETIARATGTRPAGWLGSGLQETWSTLDHLAAERVEYVCDWVNDDQPYVMTPEGGRTIVSLPYSTEINDKDAYDKRHRTADEFAATIVRQFDVLYREGAQSGRVMAIALHPYLSGQPHRIDALDRALAHVAGHPHVWLATGSEIVRHYRAAISAAA